MINKLKKISSENLFGKNNFKFLTLISMLYLACELSSLVLSYKVVNYKYFFGAASSFIFPITYTWNDLLTEVYGFKIAVRTICYVFVCDYVFVAMVLIAMQFPSESTSQQNTYEIVLGNLWRSLTAEMIGVIIGAVINSAIISKWKVLTKGKGFWYRSIISSIIGELIMLCISVPIALAGILSTQDILKLMLFSFSYKIIFAVIISGPANFLSNKLKVKEGIDVYDYNVSYNPFK